jgi:hypothetical protein
MYFVYVWDMKYQLIELHYIAVIPLIVMHCLINNADEKKIWCTVYRSID